MSVDFLLDTNVLSEPLRPAPDRRVLQWIERHREGVATAAPVWNELRSGCHRPAPSAKRQKLERYLKEVRGLQERAETCLQEARHLQQADLPYGAVSGASWWPQKDISQSWRSPASVARFFSSSFLARAGAPNPTCV